MEDDPDPSPLDKLESRLERVRRGQEKEKGPGRGVSGKAMGLAFRIITELVVGVLVGATIGRLLDKWLGTTPWLVILFLVLGFVAAVTNVCRVWGREGRQAGGRNKG